MSGRSEQLVTWPTALAQERHWAYQQRFPNAAGFNIPIATQIRGPVDLVALDAAIRAVAARHESLCARFRSAGPGQLLQELCDPAEIPVHTYDLRGLDEAERVIRTRQIGSAEAARPFALSEEPTTRVHLIRTTDDELVMVLNVHHIAFDGWSSPVFFAELDDQYSALTSGRQASRAAPAHRYVDFARWQRRQVAAGAYDDQLAYWRRELADPAPPAPWPQHGVDPGAAWWAGDMVWLSFPRQLATAARQTARSLGTTLFVVGMAAYQLALHRLLEAPHLGVGTALAGRVHPRWEEVIGFFVNTAVIPSRLTGGETFRDLVAGVHGRAMRAQQNQQLPYGVLLDALAPPIQPDRTPYFQTLFLLQNYPSPERKLGSARVRSRKLTTGSARYDITFALDTLDGEMALELENRTGLVSQDTAILLARDFFGILAAVVDNPDAPVARLSPAEVAVQVHRRPHPSAGMDGLFDGLVADWR